LAGLPALYSAFVLGYMVVSLYLFSFRHTVPGTECAFLFAVLRSAVSLPEHIEGYFNSYLGKFGAGAFELLFEPASSREASA